MGETGALLVDHRLPAVPYRQWVLTFRGPVSARLGYDTKLLAKVCTSLSKRIGQVLRRRVQLAHGLARRGDLHPATLVVVQRFRMDLGLFVHLHCLVADGCFLDAPGSPFLSQSGLDDLEAVLAKVYRDLADELGESSAEVDAGVQACLAAASEERPHEAPRDPNAPAKKMTVDAYGMQLHAAVRIDGEDRAALERICRVSPSLGVRHLRHEGADRDQVPRGGGSACTSKRRRAADVVMPT